MGSGIFARGRDRDSVYRYLGVKALVGVLDAFLVLPLLLIAVIGRFVPKSCDVGIGPLPIISSRYYRKALRNLGYSVETFSDSTWHHTADFDIRGDRVFPSLLRGIRPYALMAAALLRYRLLYFYFDGGPLRVTTWLWRVEPLMLHLAGARIVVTAFGADIHDLTRTSNRLFVHGMGIEYPAHRLLRRRVVAKVDLWTRFADHIVAGVDWIEYLYYWDSLTLAPFPIDTEEWRPSPQMGDTTSALRIVHACNHREVKGTRSLIAAVENLRRDGISIELDVLENRTNDEVRAAMHGADIIVDQIIIGWYAMFALEGMALGKPVVCHIRPDFAATYEAAGLVERGEIPLIDATPQSIEKVLRRLSIDRSSLAQIGRRSRAFVETHHSIAAASRRFDAINRALGVEPGSAPPGP